MLWLLPLEMLETRYTADMHDQIVDVCKAQGIGYGVVWGEQCGSEIVDGQFLDAPVHAMWCLSQMKSLMQKMRS